MILQDNFLKIKSKMHNVVKGFISLSKPEKRFLLDMLLGVFTTNSFNLMSISRNLPYETGIKHIHKRLQRHLSNNIDMMNKINDYLLKISKKFIKEDSSLYLDGGDFTYKEASSYEKMTIVRDGSKGVYKHGFISNLLVCDTGVELLPLNYVVYSRVDENYKSDNSNTLDIIQKYININGSKGIWVLDRGYDSKILMNYLYANNCRFIIRQSHNRKITHAGREILIKDLCSIYKCKHSSKQGKYFYKHCYLENMPITVVYHKRVSDITLLCSGHLSKNEAEQSIYRYFKRWSIEDSYRFMKQTFGLETAQISNFNGIKNIAAIALFAWYILKCIEHDEELEYIAMKEAKHNKKKKVKFKYYRLAEGMKKILNYIVFNYSIKKKKNIKKILSIEDFLPKDKDDLIWV